MTPEQVDALREIAQSQTFALTDLGNAERLVAAHGRDLRHVHGIGWLAWDGKRWQRDERGETMRRAKATARAIFHDAGNCDDDDERKRIAKWARASEAEPRLRAAVTLAASEEEITATVDALDASPWQLNMANGTVDLRTGELHPHRRADLHTKITSVPYEPDAKCPRWLAFLETIFQRDAEVIAYVARMVGYSLTGSTREQVLPICWGSGSNGKSTLIETLRALLGDYAQHTPAATLLEQRTGDGIPNDLARVRGARLVTASETGDGRRLNEERVKAITGGDTIVARYMRAEWFEFVPNFKVWLSTNHLPKIRGTDHGIWRRIRLIPFEVTIPDEEQDRELPAKLMQELPGIAAWAIAGCMDWQKQGLATPDKVQAATGEYRAEQDLIGRFITECCETEADAETPARALWDAFVHWAENNRERNIPTQTAFGRDLADRGHESHKRGTVMRQGLRLIQAGGEA